MTTVQVALSEALTLLPRRSRPTMTALQHQGVQVTCWSDGEQWILRGQLEDYVRQTLPTRMLTARTVEEFWRLMEPVIEQRNQNLWKR
ncbi:hypothetical protein [Deinococcus aquatilis]|uniref:hypothetical protein n=1 Tax=Deinococcus aquatilis TaxID=519440 RepID=UPI0012FCF0AF|nr:hypothetical protein [Deinococcus aquatilis]